MYSNPTASGPVLGGGAALPFTGLSFSLIWVMLAAFALLTAGGALLRIFPSLHSDQAAVPALNANRTSTVKHVA